MGAQYRAPVPTQSCSGFLTRHSPDVSDSSENTDLDKIKFDIIFDGIPHTGATCLINFFWKLNLKKGIFNQISSMS